MAVRKIVFSVVQLEELIADPRLAVALVRVLKDDLSMPVNQALSTAKALLKQYDMFEAGKAVNFGSFQVVDGSTLSPEQVATAFSVPSIDDLRSAERVQKGGKS